MRDTADLGQAMARETAELMPRTSAEEILTRGRRRARRRTAAVAGAAVVAMALPVAFLPTGDGGRGDLPVGATPSSPAPSSPAPSATAGPPTRPPDPGVGCPADPRNARTVGETIWTGATSAGGADIVVRFLRDDAGDPERAGFAAGLGDQATGRVDRLGCTFMFALPPVAEDYPSISAEFEGPDFDGPDATTTIVGSLVGPVERITATYDGKPLTVDWTRWSEHPEVVVYWVAGVPAGGAENPRDAEHPLLTFYDTAGGVIDRPAG